MTTAEIADVVQSVALPAQYQLGEHAVREVVTDLETMGLVETWIDARGNAGRVKQIRTTFDPGWVRAAQPAFVAQRTAADEDDPGM